MDIELLRDWSCDARRALENELDRLKAKAEQLSDFMRVMEATDELISKLDDQKKLLERMQAEIDQQSEERDAKQREIDDLRMQLVEAREGRLLEAQSEFQERQPRPTEIHNHFESGSSAQVFNSKVTGKIKDKKKWKRSNKKIV